MTSYRARATEAVALRRPETIARQSACPSGLLGRLIGSIMARETARANTFALELLDLQPTDRVLEVVSVTARRSRDWPPP
jgi:hypothetical protein